MCKCDANGAAAEYVTLSLGRFGKDNYRLAGASRLPIPELPFVHDSAISGDCVVGNDLGGRWLADLCPDASAAGSGTGGFGAICAGRAAVPGFRAYGGPAPAPIHSAGLLCRVRGLFRAAAGAHLARGFVGVAHLRGAAGQRRGAIVQWSGRPIVLAAIGEAGTFPQCRDVELVLFPNRDHPGTHGGWVDLRLCWKSRTGICMRHGGVLYRGAAFSGYARRRPAAKEPGGAGGHDSERPPLHLAQQVDSWLHVAGSFCRAAGRRGGAAAGVCRRDPAHRPLRPRSAACGARRGCRPGCDLAGPLSAPAAGWSQHAVLRGRIRRVHRSSSGCRTAWRCP